MASSLLTHLIPFLRYIQPSSVEPFLLVVYVSLREGIAKIPSENMLGFFFKVIFCKKSKERVETLEFFSPTVVS